MTPLIDADVLLHELGWSGEFKDKESGEPVLLPPEDVLELLDKKIEGICVDTDATTDPILFVTDSPWLCGHDNKRRKWRGEELRVFTPNFRYEVAKTQPYKGNRKNPKPFHFYNILTHMLHNYNVVVSDDGYEADDMICMHQVASKEETIVCSRDKDLRICPGWHFSWECGKQGAIHPHETDRVGSLGTKANGDVIGYGLSFFFYQMLVGDSADHIPGLRGWGTKKAYGVLEGLTTEEELFSTVKQLYKDQLGEGAKEYFREMSALLWMVQEKGKIGYEASRIK